MAPSLSRQLLASWPRQNRQAGFGVAEDPTRREDPLLLRARAAPLAKKLSAESCLFAFPKKAGLLPFLGDPNGNPKADWPLVAKENRSQCL